ncbi:uncharacterized protein V1518DRAFT_418358 [Limtongia smithiae]|uniref:uncharacterized protein n=1 Tax=Limtongia smithiae TaxID=1125753 RepID=UPI0034CEA3B7
MSTHHRPFESSPLRVSTTAPATGGLMDDPSAKNSTANPLQDMTPRAMILHTAAMVVAPPMSPESSSGSSLSSPKSPVAEDVDGDSKSSIRGDNGERAAATLHRNNCGETTPTTAKWDYVDWLVETKKGMQPEMSLDTTLAESEKGQTLEQTEEQYDEYDEEYQEGENIDEYTTEDEFDDDMYDSEYDGDYDEHEDGDATKIDNGSVRSGEASVSDNVESAMDEVDLLEPSETTSLASEDEDQDELAEIESVPTTMTESQVNADDDDEIPEDETTDGEMADLEIATAAASPATVTAEESAETTEEVPSIVVQEPSEPGMHSEDSIIVVPVDAETKEVSCKCREESHVHDDDPVAVATAEKSSMVIDTSFPTVPTAVCDTSDYLTADMLSAHESTISFSPVRPLKPLMIQPPHVRNPELLSPEWCPSAVGVGSSSVAGIKFVNTSYGVWDGVTTAVNGISDSSSSASPDASPRLHHEIRALQEPPVAAAPMWWRRLVPLQLRGLTNLGGKYDCVRDFDPNFDLDVNPNQPKWRGRLMRVWPLSRHAEEKGMTVSTGTPLTEEMAPERLLAAELRRQRVLWNVLGVLVAGVLLGGVVAGVAIYYFGRGGDPAATTLTGR